MRPRSGQGAPRQPRWISRARGTVAVALAVLAGLSPSGARAEKQTGTLMPTVVKDLYYGDVLFYYFQDDYFSALTRLLAAQEKNRLSHHPDEAELLLGGLYLSDGQHLQAGAIFERLLDRKVSPAVRNRAWFYLGKVWFQRGYWQQAERALRKVEGDLTPGLDAERRNLLAQLAIEQGRYDDAIAQLSGWATAGDGKSLGGRKASGTGRVPADWAAYAQFNLGVALVRKERLADAAVLLNSVGQMNTEEAELLALKDKANLALGFAYLQAEQPEQAKPVLQRVRLEGPQSAKALLALGWADAAGGRYSEALVPWTELQGRNLLDAAVQESYLAVPYAFARLEANAQAVEYYTTALKSYEEESKRLDEAIAAIRGGRLLKAIVESERADEENRQGGRVAGDRRSAQNLHGWFWQLENLPDAPESRYLYHLLAGNEFQEGLKNYRDLKFMQRNLAEWSRSLDAFDNMLDTRRVAHERRLPHVEAVLGRNDPDQLAQARVELESRLNSAENGADFVALGTAEEQQMWAKVLSLEEALAAQPDDASLDEAREKLRLMKGVLYWRLNESYKARLWSARRGLKDLDREIRDMQKRRLEVGQARGNAAGYTETFATRVDALQPRINDLNRRLVTAEDHQGQYLAAIAVGELQKQKERLVSYQLQARYALATIYDRSSSDTVPASDSAPTSEPGSAAVPPATAPAPAPAEKAP